MENDYFCVMIIEEKELVMVGAGGHALSIAEFANHRISGYLSPEENPLMPGFWFGDDSEKGKWISKGIEFHMGFVYSGWPVMEARRRLLEEYKKAGAKFTTIIAPTAIITPNSTVGDGCAIMTGAIVNRAALGENVIVNSGAIIEHDCEVGQNTFIGPGAIVGGFTKIGENCFIGLGTKISNGITIGSDITVAMGAIVNKSLSEPGIYHGSPLKRTPLKTL